MRFLLDTLGLPCACVGSALLAPTSRYYGLSIRFLAFSFGNVGVVLR